MYDTHDLGPFFVQRILLKSDAPRLHRAITDELDEPYRQSRSLVVRLFLRQGIALGIWRKTGRDEDTAIVEALRGELNRDVVQTEAGELEEGVYMPITIPADSQQRIDVERGERLDEAYGWTTTDPNTDAVRAAARRGIARYAVDLDDELEITNMLGLNDDVL